MLATAWLLVSYYFQVFSSLPCILKIRAASLCMKYWNRHRLCSGSSRIFRHGFYCEFKYFDIGDLCKWLYLAPSLRANASVTISATLFTEWTVSKRRKDGKIRGLQFCFFLNSERAFIVSRLCFYAQTAIACPGVATNRWSPGLYLWGFGGFNPLHEVADSPVIH